MKLRIAFPDSFPLQGGERDAFEEKLRDEKVDARRPYQLSDLLPLRRIGDGHVCMDATNRPATTTLPAPGRAGAGLFPALSHQAQQRQVLTTVDNGIEVDHLASSVAPVATVVSMLPARTCAIRRAACLATATVPGPGSGRAARHRGGIARTAIRKVFLPACISHSLKEYI